MKGNKILGLLLAVLMVVTCLTGCAKKEASLVDGTYTGSAQGFASTVTVTLEVKDGAVSAVTIDGSGETHPTISDVLTELTSQLEKAGSAEIDGVSGATYTSNAVKEAAASAYEQAATGEATTWENKPVTYNEGTYEGTSANGYNGPLTLSVTFSKDAITDIEVTSSKETAHVGTVAYDIIKEDAIAANGAGVDSVSGATFTSKAYKEALINAAEAAGASDLDAFKKNTVVHEAQADITGTYDVVVVGAGGAGMATAAEASMKGLSVLVIEENAEIGGNTLVSGGQFQGVMPYLVWEEDNPEATTGEFNGETYDKVKNAAGNLTVLRTIANWSEEPFDEDYYKDHEYVAGEIEDISQHGVHAEYLQTLKDLKKEINAYLKWADAKMAAGTPENELTLFSTVNLHIFQTYYGGLRQSADKTTWIYGDYDLVSQFCNKAYDLKVWLEDQGADFNDGQQLTLIGALWYRENKQLGYNGDNSGNWGAYFESTENTLLNNGGEIMLRTTADSLITDANGKVTGVNATRYDGTKVTVTANDGVVLTTGGYAANVGMVVNTNVYWDPDSVTTSIKTTNRSSLQGDGIKMGEDVGAATTGLGFAQMMPISWIDNGNLAFGGGQYAVYINPTTGTRFVNEFAERDVLSLGEFDNGIEYNGVKGVFMEMTNANTDIGIPYSYNTYEKGQLVSIDTEEHEGRVYYFSNKEELQAILDEFGMEASPDTIYETIEAYDKSIMAGEQPSDGIAKGSATTTIGTVERDADGNYLPDTYKLEGEKIRIRIMAPSTHHTMGGLVVDLDRHVLNDKGEVIEGLYAAGEVTGGIHGGNRLGGNAIVEIYVSGITAADTIAEEAGK